MDGYGVAYWTTAASAFDTTAQKQGPLRGNPADPAPVGGSPAADAAAAAGGQAVSSPNPPPTTEGAGSERTYRDRMRPVVYKSTRPALNDLNLRSLVSGTSSHGLLAHIRAGTGLTPVVETNNHPFLFGRYAFAHNGVLSHFSRLRIRLLRSLRLHEARDAILGTTDSEHMAALFFERLVGGKRDEWAAMAHGKRYSELELAETMRGILTELEGWVGECVKEEEAEGLETTAKSSSLNLVVTDGSQMVAIRCAAGGREPPSLYYSTTAGATLNRLYEGNPDMGHPELEAMGHTFQQGSLPKEKHSKHVIVASEPSTYDEREWTLVPAQHMVIVGDDYVPVVQPI